MRSRNTFYLIPSFLLLTLTLTPGPSCAEQQRVCVSEFSNLGGSEEDDWLSCFIPDCVENDLRILPEIRVVQEKWPRTPLPADLAADPDAVRLKLCERAQTVNAQFILGGDFRRDGDKISVDIAFFDAGEQKQIGGASFSSLVPELYSRLDDLCASLVGALGLAYSDRQLARMRALPTDSVEAMELYGKALAMAPESKEREDLLRKAIRKAPRYADALSKLGVYYYENGNPEQARETLEKLARIMPDSAEAYYNLGLAYRSRGDYSRAAEMYQKAVKIEPKDSDAWNNLGVSWYLMEMPEKATEALKRAIEIDPDNSNARANIELLARNSKSPSLQDVKGSIETPDTASTVNMLKRHIESGAALYATGDYTRALEEFKKALEIQPDNFKANNNIALVYLKLGETEEAREHLKLALKADPTAIDVSENLARLQEGAASAKPAEGTGKSQLSDQSHSLCIAGEIYLSKRAYAEAADAFSQALAASPNDVDALNGLGTTYFAMGQYENAREQFNKALAKDPENETAKKKLEDVGFVLAAANERPENGQALRLTIPAEVEARGRLVRGGELYKAGNYEQALGEYLRALDLAPTSIDILNNLGNTYFALHRHEEAKATFEKARALDPDNELIKGNLEALEMAESANQPTDMKSLGMVSKGPVEDKQKEAGQVLPEISTPSSLPEKAQNSGAVNEEQAPPENSAAHASVHEKDGPDIPPTADEGPESMEKSETTEKAHLSSAKEKPEKKRLITAGGFLNDSAQGHFNAGIRKEEEGNLEGALSEYCKAVELEPANASAQYNLGNVYFHLGAFQSAIECYEAAVKANPSLSEGYNNIGVAYYRMGKEREAVAAWLRALEVDPKMSSALENLEKFAPKGKTEGS